MADYILSAKGTYDGKGFTGGIRASERALDSFKGKCSAVSVAVGNVLAGAFEKGMAAVSSSTDAAIARVDKLNQFPKVMKNLGFETDVSQKAIDKMSDSIDGLPTTLDEIVGNAQQLALSLGNLDRSTDVAIALNDGFITFGASSEQVSNAIVQLNQMITNGKYDMQSWLSINQSAPGYLDTVARSILGQTKKATDLREALNGGKVTSEQFLDAIVKLDREGAKGITAFSESARTATGGIQTSMQNAKTAVVKNLANVIDALNGDGAIAKFFDGVKAGINATGKMIVPYAEKLGKMASALDENPAAIDAMERAKGVMEDLAPLAEEAKSALPAVFEEAKDFAGDLVPPIMEVKDALSGSVIGAAKKAVPAIGELGEAAEEVAVGLADLAADAAPALADVIDIGSDMASDLVPVMGDVADVAGDVMDAIGDGAEAFHSLGDGEKEAAVQAAILVAAWGPLSNIAAPGISRARDAIDKFKVAARDAGGASQLMLGKIGGLAQAGAWGILAIAAAGTAKGVADLVDHMGDMETIADGSTGALKTLFSTDASVLEESAEGASRSVEDVGKTVREVTDEAARLLSDMAEDFADVSTDNARLESYADAIGRITEKSNPTKDDLYELQGAVAAVNDALGTEYGVQEGFAGHLEVIDENGRNATQAILDLIDAQQLQRQQEAMSGYMDDVWAQKSEDVKALKTAYEELQSAQKVYDSLERQAGETGEAFGERQDAATTRLNNAKNAYEEAQRTLDAMNTTYQNLTDSTTLLAAAQQNGAESLEWAVANSQTLMTAMAEADKSTLDFASDLSQAGVSATEFAGLSDTALLDLAASYDGTFASIAGILSENGVHWDEDAAKVMTAADSMAQSATRLDGNVQTAIAQMQVRTGQSFEDFCRNLADAGASAEDFAELTPEQMAQVVSSYDGTVESVSALLEKFVADNREKGEEGSSAYAGGIEANAGEAASASQGMASDAASSADAYGEFYAKGENNAEGFAAGIRAKAAQAATEAASMVINAVAAAAGAQKSASPSKVTKKLGNYFDDGFTIGISASAKEPAREAADMVRDAIDALDVDGTWTHGYHAAINYADGLASGKGIVRDAAEDLNAEVDSMIAGYRSRANDFKEASREIGDAIWGGIAGAIGSLGREKVDTHGVYAAFDAIRKAGYDLDGYSKAVADYNRESAEWADKLAASRKEIKEGYAEWRAEEDYKKKIAAIDAKIAKAEAKASKSKKSSGSKELARLKAQKEAIQDKYEAQRDAAKYAKEAAEWQDKLKNGDASLNEQYAAWMEDNAELKKLMTTVQKNATMDDLAEWWNVAEMKAAVNDATEAADGYSETLDALFKKSNTFSDAGVVFTKGFVEKFISGSEDYKDALAKLGKMTTEQIQHMVDCYEDSARAERELEMNQRSLWVNGLKATTSGAKNVKDLMLDFRDTCLDVKEAVYGDAGLTAAFGKAGVSFEGFAMDLQSVGYTMEDFKSKYDSMVQTVSNGFQRMSRENQVSAADWKYNLQANMAESQAFADNLAKVMAKIPESIDSDAFRKAVLEGGYSQFGQMMMDMASMSAQQVGEMVKLYNESIIEGQQSAIEQFQAIAPGEEMMLAAIEGINSLNADLAAAAGDAAHGAAEEMASYSMEFTSIGSLLIDGASSGVMARASTLAEAAAAVVRNAIAAAKAEAGIHSPSLVMNREIGQMMGAGLGLGIDKSARLAVDAMGNMVGDTMGAARTALASKAGYLADLPARTTFSGSLRGSAGADGMGGKGASASPTFNISATVREEADIDKLAYKVGRVWQREARERGYE